MARQLGHVLAEFDQTDALGQVGDEGIRNLRLTAMASRQAA